MKCHPQRCLLSLLLLFLGTSFAPGQPTPGRQPGGHLKVTEVLVDFSSDTIVITGEDFDFGVPLTIALGELGDISDLCAADVGPPQVIVCDFSISGLPDDGDYLLTVATGPGQSQSDEYDLTIGSAGPTGPSGPPGPSGVLAFYTRTASDSVPGPGDPPDFTTLQAEAFCDPGDSATGGGVEHNVLGPNSSIYDIASRPNVAGTGWIGSVRRIQGAGSSLTVYVRCADVTP